jgi:hypothetical protein
MELPLKFPDHHEEARKRAAEFQRLSPSERWRAIGDVIESGLELIRSSPHREAIERVTAEREREWQNIQKELFRRHGG